MPKRCPPGVFCIENMTLGVLGVASVGIVWYAYSRLRTQSNAPASKEEIKAQQPQSQNIMLMSPPQLQLRPDPDVLLNPYDAPLRDDRYFLCPQSGRVPMYAPPMPVQAPMSVPINIPTQYPGGMDSTFRQVGILTRLNGSGDLILPLMGKPLITNRDKWNFYTMNDKNTMIKLPITFKGKSCTNEYGCDNIYNNDTVYVEGYKDAFKATIYDNQTMRYLPFL